MSVQPSTLPPSVVAARTLASTPFFAALEAIDLARLVPELEEWDFQPGEVVFRQGEPGDGLYLIRSGTAGVSIVDAAGPRIVAVLQPPAYFGEMALISAEPRTATIVALGPLALWKLPRERFDGLLARHPRLLRQVAAELTRRLSDTTRQLAASQDAVASVARAAYAALEPGTRALLREVAVLPEFDPASLRAALGPEQAEPLVGWLEREWGFFCPADRPGWYRIAHDSLRDFLLEQLEAEVGPEELWVRRRKAAQALLAAGEAGRWHALDVLGAGGALSSLAEALEACGPVLVEQDPRRLQGYLELLPESSFCARPPLVHLLVECCLRQEDAEQADDVLRRAAEWGVALGSANGEAGSQEVLAAAYERLGRADEAEACLRRVQQLTGVAAGAATEDEAADWPVDGSGAERQRRIGRLALVGARASRQAVAALAAPFRVMSLSTRRLMVLAVVVLVSLAWLLPPPAGLSPAGLRVLVLLVAVLLLGFLNILPDYLLGLLMIGAWVFTGTVPARAAAVGFASSTWFLLLSSMALGVAVARSGLLYRLALESVGRLPQNQAVRCLTLALFGTAFSAGMSSTSGRLVLAAPLAQDMAESLRYGPRSAGSAGLGLATYLGFGQLGSVFLTGSAASLVVYGLLPPDVQVRMSWGAWFLAALPAHLVVGGLTLACLLLHHRPEAGGMISARTLAVQRNVLGRPSAQELSTGLIVTLLILGFVTQPLHGLNPAWLAVAAVAGTFLAGALDDASLRGGINWGLLLYLGIALGFGEVFAQAGLDHWLGQSLAGLGDLVGGSPELFVLVVAAVGALLGLLLRAGPSSAVLSLTLYPTAAAVGVSPWVVGMVFLLTTNLWLYPQQSVYYLTAYYGMGERGFSHAQARPVAIAYAAAVFLAIAISLPYWRWLGLIG